MDTINITKIYPMFTSLVTTADRYEDDVFSDGGLIEASKGDIKPYQTVVAIGPNVPATIKVGSKVMLDVKRFLKPKHENSIKDVMKDDFHVLVDLDQVVINGVPHFLLQDRDVAFVFEGEETLNKKQTIVQGELDWGVKN